MIGRGGVGGSPPLRGGGLRHILSTSIPPSCLLSWYPLFFPRAPLVAVGYYHSPHSRPRVPVEREHMLSLNVSRKDFFPSLSLSTCHHLQHPAVRTCTAKPAWLSLHTRSSVTKRLPDVTHPETAFGKQSCSAFREHLRYQRLELTCMHHYV